MTGISLLYVTAPDTAVADRIATTLVAENLAACVNSLGAITSVYKWENAVCRADEVALLIKTTSVGVPPVIARLEQLHPYDTPCIVEIPVTGGADRFLSWIETSVGS